MPVTLSTKAEVNYTPANPEPERICGNCEFYDYSKCQIVVGAVERRGVCDKWSDRHPNKKKSGDAELTCCDPDYM